MTTSLTDQSPQRAAGGSGRLRALLREWRDIRNLSQLALALEVKVSQRHLSFIESGRTKPSREMVLRLASALDLPLRARNDLLAAAGFAALFPERSLGADDMRVVRAALERILAHHEPYPAMVVDRYWNVVMKNRANARVMGRFVDVNAFARRSPDGKLNFIRVMFSDDGLRPHVKNWAVVAPQLIARVRRESAANPDSPSTALLKEFGALAPSAPAPDDTPLAPMVPLALGLGDSVLQLVNMLTTFGTPQDVGVQELRVEMAFPADATSDALLRAWAADEEAGRRP